MEEGLQGEVRPLSLITVLCGTEITVVLLDEAELSEHIDIATLVLARQFLLLASFGRVEGVAPQLLGTIVVCEFREVRFLQVFILDAHQQVAHAVDDFLPVFRSGLLIEGLFHVP